MTESARYFPAAYAGSEERVVRPQILSNPERVGAAYRSNPGCRERVAQPTIAELEAHLRQHVAATHIPVKWCFVESLPRNRSVKVDRPALRTLFESEAPR
jgi:acyl-coenzyme A synthetase/AMP-(fatty) acid ligase